jgi:peptidoglycan/LPS O-acetylase OafA/YrhL
MKAMRDKPAVAPPAPPTRYYASNIALSLVAALIGGWVTARVSGPPVRNSLVGLAVLVLAMGLVSALMSGSDSQPAWYKLVIPLIGVAGVALSAALVGG